MCLSDFRRYRFAKNPEGVGATTGIRRNQDGAAIEYRSIRRRIAKRALIGGVDIRHPKGEIAISPSCDELVRRACVEHVNEVTGDILGIDISVYSAAGEWNGVPRSPVDMGAVALRELGAVRLLI